MELYGWQQCQRNPTQHTGTLSLLPPSWDTISVIYNQVVRLVSKFPGSKRLVLYFAYKGATVKLDLGDVKAAGLVCLIGLGVGLGTLYVYRLYHRYIQPLLDKQWSDQDTSSSSDCRLCLDSSDNDADTAASHTSRQSDAAVLYCQQYGLALAGKSPSSGQQTQRMADSVRLRRLGTQRKPVHTYATDRDSRSDVGSSLSPSLYELNIRDSFYSTAESGFETLAEGHEDEDEEDVDFDHDIRQDFSASLLGDVRGRHISSSSGERTASSPSGNKTVVEVVSEREASNDAGLHAESRTISAKSSPLHRDSRLAHTRKRRDRNYPHRGDLDYDPSLDASESVQSSNSSEDEWEWEAGDEHGPTVHLPNHTALTDSEFRQSLMQRIHEWSSFAEEHRRSRSPSPGCVSVSPPPRPRHLRRSRSLEPEPTFEPDVDVPVSEPLQVEDTTVKNLECLQTEFQDIQDEFESITSKLHDLIERGSSDDSNPDPPANSDPPAKRRPSHLPIHQYHSFPRSSRERPSRERERTVAKPPYHHTRTKWERVPSLPRSESSRSSRASSVEFSWDCGEDDGCGEDAGERGGGDGGVRKEVDAGLGDEASGPEEADERLMVDPEGGPDIGGGDCDKLTSVGEAVGIVDYAHQEWRGETAKANTIKQGYLAIPRLFQCQRLRRVRGDNYCALRSTLFQVLVGGHQVTRRWPGVISIVDELHRLSADSSSGLEEWTFAGRLNCGHEDKLSRMTQCVLSLYATIKELSALPCSQEREARTLSLLNSANNFDVELMEGLKLLMLLHANRLQQQLQQEEEVPVFVALMFARDTSEDTVSLVRNHLNHVGDSAGVDQVELCLLGHSLGVKLRVARLDHHGQQDFLCSLPDEAPDDWPCVCLLAEDDRHYNVPVA